jgi:hypothetical protein
LRHTGNPRTRSSRNSSLKYVPLGPALANLVPKLELEFDGSGVEMSSNDLVYSILAAIRRLRKMRIRTLRSR